MVIDELSIPDACQSESSQIRGFLSILIHSSNSFATFKGPVCILFEHQTLQHRFNPPTITIRRSIAASQRKASLDIILCFLKLLPGVSKMHRYCSDS